jgi:cation transport ATPase
MARARTLILVETGTLTDGRPRIVSIDTHDGIEADELLRLAAALDRLQNIPWRRQLLPAPGSAD